MYNDIYYTTIPPEYQEQIEIQKEKAQLKKQCNFVGIVVLITTFIFMGFNIIAVFMYALTQNYATPATVNTSNDSIAINLLSGLCNIAAIGICGAVFIKRTNTHKYDALPFNKVGLKKLLALCVIGFTVCNLSNLMTNIFISNAYSLGIHLNIDSTNYNSNSVLEIIVYILSVAVVPAFSEELLFRGVVLGSLRKYGDGLAVFVSSLFFGIFHGNFIQFPFAFVVGIMLSFTVVYTNSMMPAIIIHFMNNCFSVIYDILYTNAARWNFNETILDISFCAFIAVTSLISLLALSKIEKKDKNFMKLTPYEGVLERKSINKTILTNPLIIITFLILLGETVLTHLSI